MKRLCLAVFLISLTWPVFGDSSKLSNQELSVALDLIQTLCITKGKTTSVSGNVDSNSGPTAIATETAWETAFLITPDRRVEPINKERIVSSTTETREITLPDGRQLSGTVTIINKQVACGQNKIGEEEAKKGASCIKAVLELDSVNPKLPDYFNPTLVPAFPADKLRAPNLRSDSDTISFLSDTRLQVASSSMTVHEPNLIRVRLYPPFLLNDLTATLRAPVAIVPPYLDVPIKISAELIWSKANIQQLSPAEQDLRVYPATEWLWNVEAQKSGKADAFLRFTIFRDQGAFQKGIPFVYPLNLQIESDWRKSTALFLVDNWQWIAGTIFVPLAVFLFHLYWPAKAAAAHARSGSEKSKRKRR
ncbi:hypothetical protein ACVWWO_001435 [Bradyrhizobium sp. F1.13.1]